MKELRILAKLCEDPSDDIKSAFNILYLPLPPQYHDRHHHHPDQIVIETKKNHQQQQEEEENESEMKSSCCLILNRSEMSELMQEMIGVYSRYFKYLTPSIHDQLINLIHKCKTLIQSHLFILPSTSTSSSTSASNSSSSSSSSSSVKWNAVIEWITEEIRNESKFAEEMKELMKENDRIMKVCLESNEMKKEVKEQMKQLYELRVNLRGKSEDRSYATLRSDVMSLYMESKHDTTLQSSFLNLITLIDHQYQRLKSLSSSPSSSSLSSLGLMIGLPTYNEKSLKVNDSIKSLLGG